MYVPTQIIVRMFFYLKLPEGWTFLKVKLSDVADSRSLNFVKTKFYEEGLLNAIMFVVSFANFKSCALSHDPLGDPVMPRAEVHFRA